jgi:hypothetical protein
MHKKTSRNLYLRIVSWFLPVMLLYGGCSLRMGDVLKGEPLPPKVGKMVVVGFRPAMSQRGASGMIRSPISGAVFMAEPVAQDVVDRMTEHLFSTLLGDKSYDLISPNQAKGVFASIVSSGQNLEDIEIFQKIGQTFSADTVLIGYIYRWREREGTDYSVNRPASTAFDLYLTRSHDGAVLWKGRFDKTQRSLSENILDMETFIKGKGRWMTVDRLAKLGLSNLMSKFPSSKTEKKD